MGWRAPIRSQRDCRREARDLRGELERAQETTGNLQMELARNSGADRCGDSRAGGGGDAEEVARLRKELEHAKEELRKSQEEQLGASLRARRKEKELKEQLKKCGGAPA